MTLPKDHNNFPVTNPKDMEICNLPDREFKIVVLRKLSELQENTERQPNKIRKVIHKQDEEFNKEIEIIKNNQMEILELKNTMNERKNAIKSTDSRMDQTEERICELRDRSFEIIQSEENKEKKNEKVGRKPT